MEQPHVMALQTNASVSQETVQVPCGALSVNGNERSAGNDLCTEISLKEFLDFLCTAYQVAEAIDGTPNDVSNKSGVNWAQLTNNPLITRLLDIEEANPQNGAQDICQNSTNCLDPASINNSITVKDRNNVETDKRKTCSAFQRMQSVSIDCLQNAQDSVVPKPLERRLSTGSLVLSNDFPLKTSLLKPNQTENNASPQTAPQLFTVDAIMKRKLNEVIEEGILDSVLPYLVPKQIPANNIAASQSSLVHKSAHSEPKRNLGLPEKCHNLHESADKGRRKSMSSSTDSSKPDLEVEIHVCDEVKNLKKDFRCPQKLLVSKMGYFAEVTTGQKLEDMDISVHCDLSIFDWLMRWVKKDLNPHESPPSLDASNVVPILVSAAFLQMEPLMQDCLRFCHKNMNSILRTSTNLACLNDSILTKLANLYSNADVELLRDKKDRVQSRLYCKLISVLAEPKPDVRRGHYASLAALFKCSRCGKLILRQLGSRIACKIGSSRLDRNGTLHGIHSREVSWNLSEYIKNLRSELKSWRRVYWRLWGDCHFQYCSLCHSHFPAHQRNWCLYHTDPPQFFSMENQRALSYPIGRYPCCGERAFRFEVVRSSMGCHFRAHQPVCQTPTDAEVERIFQAHSCIIASEPPLSTLPDRISRLVSSSSRDPEDLNNPGTIVGRNKDKERDVHWWDGLELAPVRSQNGLLGRVWDSYQQRLIRAPSPVSTDTSCTGPPTKTTGIRKQMSVVETGSSTTSGVVTSSGGMSSSLEHDTSSEMTSSESEELSDDNSEESCHTRFRPVKHRRRRTGARRMKPITTSTSSTSSRPVDIGPQWISKLSTRNNQDNQREYEERAVRHMAALLTRRTSGVSGSAVGGHHRSSRHHHHHHSHHHHHNHSHHHHSMWNGHYTPPGGTYVRIEAEWREQHAACANLNVRSRPATSSHSLIRQKSKNGR